MAITSLDGVIAGTQPPWHIYKQITTTNQRTPMSCWGVAGIPAAGTWNSTLNGGTYSSSSALVNGQIPHFDPVAGNSYLQRFVAMALTTNALVLLCDRLWDNGGINVTSTASQAIASPTWPARDLNGATAGAGVLIGVEVQAACASTTTLTLGYTNSAGTSGRTAVIGGVNWNATVANAGAFFPQASGDIGVQSVQSIQLTASMTSGTINLVAFRVIAGIDAAGTSGTVFSRALDPIKGCFQRVYNGTVPFLMFICSGNTGFALNALYQESQG